ncbi:MAG TPA: hypothetical protein VF185_01970 [Patescibacteria group bacterium]
MERQDLIFEPSGLVKDPNNKEELEFWGHDGGEFVPKKSEEESGSNKEKKLETVGA